MYLRVAAALALSSLLTFGCQQSTGEATAPPAVAPAPQVAEPAAPEEATPVAAVVEEAAPEEESCAKKGVECGAEKHGVVEAGCENIAAEQLTNPKEEAVTRADGTPATHVGDAFTGVDKVAVSALLADPGAWRGKTISLEGDVSAMCGHMRGWFALAAEDKSGRQVRVLTAPTFLVPAGSVGRSATTEGTVEVIEIAAEHARHLAGEHKLGDPAEITANVQQVVIRARGAEFF
ncbi:MAG: hypothetical protein CVU56_26125 [Deltaproteobacteria bacterium HGW-Deltaproteobacteria-14]|jgi:hypothetical protein|nr:MAG: hypothetical protein CVU56_26125 [Deltaproteobacteria bacterium HGW-Deltaproteobacteria-14]